MGKTERSWSLWRCLLTGLNVLAFALSAVISWHWLAGGSAAGCGAGSPCEQVLNSRWSAIAGIVPVSALAMGVYLSMLVAGFYIRQVTDEQVKRLAWNVMIILSGAVTGSALWFIILQKWIIGDFCIYCMTAHITGLLLTSLIIWRAAVDSPVQFHHRSEWIKKFFIGMILAGVLAVSQVGLTPSAAYTGGKSKTSLPAIDYRTVPMTGLPDAPYVVTLLFDYKCPHCQKLHFMLDEAVLKYKGKLAFVLCPAPLDTQCNPYIPRDNDAFRNSCELTRISLAVWLAGRDAFPSFVNWMFTYDAGDRWQPRSQEAARARAIEMVGREKFDAAMTDPWIGQYMQTCIRIYGRTMQSGMGGIPKMIFGLRWVIPEPRNVDDLITILRKDLGVPGI